MEIYEIEINGTIVKITTDKKLNMSDFIVSLSKHLNGENVNVENCIYKGKKKFKQEININNTKNEII